jgi:hypothetical protein
MSRRHLLFYATAADLSPLLSSLESQKKLQYTLMDISTTSKVETHFSFVDIPDFGRPNDSTATVSRAYLVAIQGTIVHAEEVQQNAGGVRFHVSQKLNRDTVAFWPGGRYSTDILLYGQIGTISDSTASKNLYDCMAKVFRDRLMPVREFLVGPEAFNLCKAGVRLTLSASTPPEFDLRLSKGEAIE